MRKYLLLVLVLFSLQVYAIEDMYSFTNQAEQERFSQLTHHLRCLVCQNQNLSDSNAPLATDLRNQVYEQIMQGKSDEKIIDYLVSRYGNFILYQPPLSFSTLLLWLGPFFIFDFWDHLFNHIPETDKQSE